MLLRNGHGLQLLLFNEDTRLPWYYAVQLHVDYLRVRRHYVLHTFIVFVLVCTAVSAACEVRVSEIGV